MKLTRALSVCLALTALPACETLTGVAPEGTPRVEVELAVTVGDGFLGAMEDVDARSDLVRKVHESVLSKADLGLRFYPTPSERYGKDDTRPPYLMTVAVDSLRFGFDQKVHEEEGAEPRVQVRVDEVDCSVAAKIERRRPDAPALLIANADASSQVKAEGKAERVAGGVGYTPKFEGATPKVLERDVLRAVESAVDKSLKAMRTPIDREFAGEDEAQAGAER